jgi:signal peptidase I
MSRSRRRAGRASDSPAPPPPEPTRAGATTLLRVGASLLGPGAGHALAGHPRQAAAWLAASALVSPAVMAMTAFVMSDARVPTGALFAIVALWLVWGAAAIHAGGAAPRAGEPPRWAAAVAVLVGGMTAQLLGGWLTRTSLLAAFTVPSSNMAPTLVAGDVVFARVGLARPKIRVGQVVVFRAPIGDEHLAVGRVVALEGSVARLEGAALTVDEVRWTGPATGTFTLKDPSGGSTALTLHREKSWLIADSPLDALAPAWPGDPIPAGHAMILGDNRDFAADSRTFCPIPLDRVVGVAVIDPG